MTRVRLTARGLLAVSLLLSTAPLALPAAKTEAFTHARWIWVPATHRHKDVYAYFRKSFHLSEIPRHVRLAVTADSEYQLFLNGNYFARGPVRSDPRRKYFDLFTDSVSPLLRPGKNTIAVKVHWVGEGTFSTVMGRPGLLLELAGRVAGRDWKLYTDRSWKSAVSTNHLAEAVRINMQLDFNEAYDATISTWETAWQRVELDDLNWPAALETGPAQSPPYSKLLPRDIPFETDDLQSAQSLLAFGSASPAGKEVRIDLSGLYPAAAAASSQAEPGQQENRIVYLYTSVFSPRAQRVAFTLEASQSVNVWLNRELILEHRPRTAGTNLQDTGHVRLKKGWNPLLAKAVVGDRFKISYRDSAFPLSFGSDDKVAEPAWFTRGPFPVTLKRRVLGLYPEWAGFDRKRFAPEQEYLATGSCRVDDAWRDADASWTEIRSVARSMATSTYHSIPASRITSSNGSGWEVNVGPDEILYFVFDFGEEVSGYPVIRFSSESSGRIEAGYSEVASGDHVNPYRASAHYADSYLAGSGEYRWELFHKRAFRYMQIQIRGFQGRFKIALPSIRMSTYPVQPRGSFVSSDPRLNAIWQASLHTLRMSMEDSFIDSPWRERVQWWGDARVQALANYYHSGDPRLIRKGLQDIAYSQREDGITYAAYPTSFDWVLAPEFTMLWVFSLEEYYRFTDDENLVRQLYPRLIKAMGWFELHEGASGLLADLPHLLWVDWAEVDTEGEVTAFNCYYVETLRRAAVLARLMGDEEAHRRFLNKAEVVAAAVNQRLWDAERGIYRDARSDGKLSPVISQQANTLALLFGVAPQERWERMLDFIHSQNGEVVRSATPFFSFYVTQSLIQAGRYEHAFRELLRWYSMTREPPGTFWEYWQPFASRSHGWSCAPSILLPREVLGVKLTSPRFRSFDIKPVFTDHLEWARGKVPVVGGGEIEVYWKKEPRRFQLELSSPADTRARVSLPNLFEDTEVQAFESTPAGWLRLDPAVRESPGWIDLELESGGEYLVRLLKVEAAQK